jgi:hypothetical protein
VRNSCILIAWNSNYYTVSALNLISAILLDYCRKQPSILNYFLKPAKVMIKTDRSAYAYPPGISTTSLEWFKLPFFGQNCSLPFSLRSLDIPALFKSWQKHYVELPTSEKEFGSTMLLIANGKCNTQPKRTFNFMTNFFPYSILNTTTDDPGISTLNAL